MENETQNVQPEQVEEQTAEVVETPVEQTEQVEKAEQTEQTEKTDYEQAVARIEQYFEKVRQLVRYTKTKDETIEKLGNEIQHYRDGFIAWAFKPFAMSVINFRESCKKEMEEVDKFDLPVEKIKRNISFLVDEIEDLLLANGCDEDDGKYFYNGKEIVAPVSFGEEFACDTAPVAEQKPAQETTEETVEETIENTPVVEMTWEERIEKYHAELSAILADNSVLEKMVQKGLFAWGKKDTENKWLYIRHALYLLVNLKEATAKKEEALPDDLENLKKEYVEILQGVSDSVALVLDAIGVTILQPEDTFDTKYHRLIKAVPTGNPELDRKINRVMSDAYELDGKVIYQQKVEVLTYKR